MREEREGERGREGDGERGRDHVGVDLKECWNVLKEGERGKGRERKRDLLNITITTKKINWLLLSFG
jgi:hypothetical protein